MVVDENDNLLCQNFISSENLVDLEAYEEDSPIPAGEAQSHSGAASEETKDKSFDANTEEHPFILASGPGYTQLIKEGLAYHST